MEFTSSKNRRNEKKKTNKTRTNEGWRTFRAITECDRETSYFEATAKKNTQKQHRTTQKSVIVFTAIVCFSHKTYYSRHILRIHICGFVYLPTIYFFFLWIIFLLLLWKFFIGNHAHTYEIVSTHKIRSGIWQSAAQFNAMQCDRSHLICGIWNKMRIMTD